MNIRKKLTIILIIILNIFVFSYGTLYSKISKGTLSKIIIESLGRWHYSGKPLNKKFFENGLNEFIKALDYDKRFLLKSDVEYLKKKLYEFTDGFKDGNTELMNYAFYLKNNRINQVIGFYPSLLKGKIDFNKDESFETDPEKRDYFNTLTELKAYWKKRLKYSLIIKYIYLKKENDKKKKDKLSDEKLIEKAKKDVLKTTGKILKQIKKSGKANAFSRFLNSVLSVFDPHTSYFPPKDKQDFDIEMSGSLEGIGALLTQENDFVKVVEIIPGGPAWKQKQLGPEDKILKVAQGNKEAVDVVGMRTTDAVKLIRGKKGSLVKLTVKKPDGRIVIIPIIRDIVIIEETFAKSMIIYDNTNKIGYISLKSFYDDFSGKTNRTSYNDVKKEIEKLRKEKVDGIIFDLRGNRGGALTDAVNISGLFIKEGPVVQVKGRYSNKETLDDPDPNIIYDGPLVIMINALSASASEIMAAALQDYRRAVVVGDSHSFGKGTVQTLIDIKRLLNSNYDNSGNSGALKLTIKKFYRISGGSNQFKGVVPDIILPGIYDSFEIGEQFLDHSLKWDTITSAKYSKYELGADIEKIKNNSKKRVKTNKYFRELLSYNKELKKKKENSLQSLRIKDIIAEQQHIKDKLERIKKARVKDNRYKFKFFENNNNKKDKEMKKVEKDRINNWRKSLEKDMELFESVSIIKDLIIERKK